MINLIEFPTGREIKNVTKEDFSNNLSLKINKNIIDFIVSEDKVEITYDKYENKYRFDFVNIEPLLNKVFLENVNRDEEYEYEFINIDLDLDKNIIVLYVELDSFSVMLNSIPLDKKEEFIKKFKEFKSILDKDNFYLEVYHDSTIHLVSDNLKSLTVDNISNALNSVEEFIKLFIEFKVM